MARAVGSDLLRSWPRPGGGMVEVIHRVERQRSFAGQAY